MSRKSALESNFWKYFIFTFSQRRNFLPILSIVFLTIPDATANQIGLWSGIGGIASFFFEIPSSYFADVVGHKKTLIIAKILMVLSTALFLFAPSWVWFAAGSALFAISLAFVSGTDSAFLHNTLTELKREDEYTKISGKISANVSLLSIIPIVALPFLTEVSIKLPLQIWLAVDIIGFFVALMFVSPEIKRGSEEKEISLLEVAKNVWGNGFYVFSVFIGVTGGLIVGSSNFHSVYLKSIGYPVVLLGVMMGLSRFFWFAIGHNLHRIEKFGMKKIMLFEMMFFPLACLLAITLRNPYFVALILSLMIGYYWSRNSLMTSYTLKEFVVDKKYKATLISIQGQIGSFFETFFSFGFGVLTATSFRLAYGSAAVAVLALTLAAYFVFRGRLSGKTRGGKPATD